MDKKTKEILLEATFEIMSCVGSLKNTDPEDVDTIIPYYADKISEVVEIMQDVIIHAGGGNEQ